MYYAQSKLAMMPLMRILPTTIDTDTDTDTDIEVGVLQMRKIACVGLVF